MNGKPPKRGSILSKDGSQTLEFQLPGLISGAHRMTLEMDDRLPHSRNRFYMTLDARGKTPVLAVEDSGRNRQRSSFFLARALNVDTFSPYDEAWFPRGTWHFSGGLLIWNDAPGGGDRGAEKIA